MSFSLQKFWQKVFPPRWWVLALLVMAATAAIDAWVNLQSTWEISQRHSDQPLAWDASSPSGYADNQHDVILPYIGMDGYHWVMQTQQMLTTGEARIRQVDYDNTPDGREVHWASAFRWWLALLAEIHHLYTATPLPQSVEAVVPVANTLLIVLLLAGVMPMVARRFGSLPAALWALGCVGIYWIYESFSEGRTDHHGLAVLNEMLTVLFLLGGGAGWIKNFPDGKTAKPPALQAWLPDRAQARRWFIASGVVGGIGLWISAASEAPVLASIGVGALLATGLLGRNVPADSPFRPDPSLWRVWGLSGAATSVFFYLLEYFPAHMEFRLEVNHPLYALAWAGGGELLCRLSRWWGTGKMPETRDWVAIGGSAVAVLTLPFCCLFYSARAFWVLDPFLSAYHNDYIMEFVTMGTFLKSQPLFMRIVMLNPLLLLAFPIFWWSLQDNIPRPAKALMLLALPSALITFLALSLWQIRWTEGSYGLWLVVLVGVATAIKLQENFLSSIFQKIAVGLFLAWALLPNLLNLLSDWTRNDWKTPPSTIQILELITRDLTRSLRARVGNEPTVVISGPTTTTWLTYWGGFQGLGTLYWENLPGLKANADIYGGTNPNKVLELLQQHHAKYLVLLSWVDRPEEYARVDHQLRKDDPVPENAFIWHMQQRGILPQWLRPVYYPLPTDAPKNWIAQIYEIVPGQSSPEATTRLAQWYEAGGNADAAANFLGAALKIDPQCLPALTTAARLSLVAGQNDQFTAIIKKLLSLSPAANALELGDRIDFVASLSVTNDTDDMHRQLALAVQQADVRSLRRLRTDSLFLFLALAMNNHVIDQRPGLWPFARSLLRTDLQVKLLEQYSDGEKAAGRLQAAVPPLREAVGLKNDSLTTLNRLAWLLATASDASVRHGAEAVTIAEHAYALDKGQHINIGDTLACAYAEAGNFTQALAAERQALEVANTARAKSANELALEQHALADAEAAKDQAAIDLATKNKSVTAADAANVQGAIDFLNNHLVLFQNQQPFHEGAPKP